MSFPVVDLTLHLVNWILEENHQVREHQEYSRSIQRTKANVERASLHSFLTVFLYMFMPTHL